VDDDDVAGDEPHSGPGVCGTGGLSRSVYGRTLRLKLGLEGRPPAGVGSERQNVPYARAGPPHTLDRPNHPEPPVSEHLYSARTKHAGRGCWADFPFSSSSSRVARYPCIAGLVKPPRAHRQLIPAPSSWDQLWPLSYCLTNDLSPPLQDSFSCPGTSAFDAAASADALLSTELRSGTTCR